MLAQKDKIRRALIRENELRLAPAAQLAYSNAKTLDEIRQVTEDIQKKALEQVGIEPSFWLSLDTLRRARFFFKDDPEMNQLTGASATCSVTRHCVLSVVMSQSISAMIRATPATCTATRAPPTCPSTRSTARRSTCAPSTPSSTRVSRSHCRY